MTGLAPRRRECHAKFTFAKRCCSWVAIFFCQIRIAKHNLYMNKILMNADEVVKNLPLSKNDIKNQRSKIYNQEKQKLPLNDLKSIMYKFQNKKQ